MNGKVLGSSIVIMDAFALPVQGTETRVNAANEAYEYMVQFLEGGKHVSRAVVCKLARCDYFLGRPNGECHRVVSFSSRLRMLAIGYRRKHTNYESKIPRSIRRRSCTYRQASSQISL